MGPLNIKLLGFSLDLSLGESRVGEVETEATSYPGPAEASGEITVQEVREPQADIFAEDDHTLVVAEMPGIAARNVRLEIKADLLSLYAARGDKKYRLEVLLPQNYSRENITLSCNNGILKIKCQG